MLHFAFQLLLDGPYDSLPPEVIHHHLITVMTGLLIAAVVIVFTLVVTLIYEARIGSSGVQ